MRSDMMKVVTERPRAGRGGKNQKFGGRIQKDRYDDDDHGPSGRIAWSRKRNSGGGKEFTDLLGPLRRFLFKNVGRPWNTVYSEICRELRGTSLQAIHIRNHVKWDVEEHVLILSDGRVVGRDAMYGAYYPILGFYVHPSTGLLCSAHHQRYRKSRERREELQQYKTLRSVYGDQVHNWKLDGVVMIDDHTVWRRDEDTGIWYEHRRALTEPTRWEREYHNITKPYWKWTTKRQLNKKQLALIKESL